MKLSTTSKGILSLIGGILHQIAVDSIFPLGSLSTYIFSYFKHYDSSITLYYGYFTIAICTFALSLFSPLGGYLDNRLGIHATLFIGAGVFVCATAVFYYWITSVWFFYGIMVMYGLGLGICFTVTIKNTCLFFPKKKGLIGSFIVSAGALGKSLYNFIGETVINPTNEKIPEGQDFFDFDIAKNFRRYLLFMLFWIPGMTVIACLMIFQYKPEYAAPVERNEEGLVNEENRTVNQSNNRNDPNYRKNITKVFKKPIVYYYFCLNFCAHFLFFNINNTYKTIGALEHMSTQLFKWMASISGLCLSFSGPLWGLLYDCIGFKPIMVVITIVASFMSLPMTFAMGNEYLFAAFVFVNNIFLSGVSSALNPHMMKVFSIKYCLEIGGFVNLAMGTAKIIGTVLAFIMSEVYKSETKLSYLIVYYIGTGFAVIGLVLAVFDKNEAFDFGEKQRDTGKLSPSFSKSITQDNTASDQDLIGIKAQDKGIDQPAQA